MLVLGVESSCDETSVAILRDGKEVLSNVINSQIKIHEKFGGVVPEVASRNHVYQVSLVFKQAFEEANVKPEDIDLVAVTYGPGLNGALLVGVEAAKALSFATKIPLIKVNHMAGHIYANKFVGDFKFPLISLVVSGGHTELVYMKDEYEFEKLGETLDDAVGESYDKVARVIGVGYPGGPIIDKMAKIGIHEYKLTIPLNDDSYNFSFSGIKSAVVNLVHNEKQRGNDIRVEDMCTSFQNRAITILSKKTMKALEEYNVKNLILAGGVSANSTLREHLTKLCTEKNINISMPRLKYCTDNAAMIGSAAYYAYKKDITADLTLNAKATDNLYNVE
jgi:N6-L-threonylcarbamoyladenine synthase